MVRGIAELKRRLRSIERNVDATISREMDEIAEDLLDRSQNLANQLGGDLVNSAEITARNSSDKFTRVVSYDEDYAVVQHEGIDPRTGRPLQPGPITRSKGGTTDGPAGPKFLQRPFNNNRRRWIEQIAKKTLDAIRRSAR